MSKRARGKEVKGSRIKKEPNSKIYIFCEGTTERIYLEHFKNRSYNVEVIPVNTEHTDATGIVKFAKRYIDEAGLDMELGDRGYCIFDSDPKSNTKIGETFSLLHGYEAKGLKYIFSNPCFEVWFVLHYQDAPFQLDSQKMKKAFRKIIKTKIPTYSESTDIFDILLEQQAAAIKRAKILHNNQAKVHETVCSHVCNPFTNMYEFIEYMDEIKKKKGLKSRMD